MSTKSEVTQVARRRYWREVDARVMVEAWRRSARMLSEFADQHGVDPKRIARWASRLRSLEPAPVRFHPVRVADDGTASRGGGAIEIELSGTRRVRVAHGFEAEDLRRVLAVLAEGSRC